jgi:hypothetical protein
MDFLENLFEGFNSRYPRKHSDHAPYGPGPYLESRHGDEGHRGDDYHRHHGLALSGLARTLQQDKWLLPAAVGLVFVLVAVVGIAVVMLLPLAGHLVAFVDKNVFKGVLDALAAIAKRIWEGAA